MGLSHQGESSSSKCRYDRDSEPRVKRNSELDTPMERPPCRKCGKLHRGEYKRGSNACYSSGKPGHMIKYCLYTRGREKGKKKVQSNCEVPRRKRFIALK